MVVDTPAISGVGEKLARRGAEEPQPSAEIVDGLCDRRWQANVMRAWESMWSADP
jgi:hypothetical protein